MNYHFGDNKWKSDYHDAIRALFDPNQISSPE